MRSLLSCTTCISPPRILRRWVAPHITGVYPRLVVVCHCQLLDFWHHGILCRKCRCIGTNLYLSHSLYPMVFTKVVLCCHTFLQCILIACCFDLCDSGVGCYWGCSFVGAFSYADDVVLLAFCASAMRMMLLICCSFSVSHILMFNPTKTLLICFYAPSVRPITPTIYIFQCN